MKCNACDGEWMPPPGKDVTLCPFCSESTQKLIPGVPADNVVKKLVRQHGADVLLSSHLFSLIAESLRNGAPQMLKRMRLATNERVPQTLYNLKPANEHERTLKTNAIAFALANDYGMNIEAACEIVNYFCDALDYNPITVPQPAPAIQHAEKPVSTTPKQRNNIHTALSLGSIITFGEYDWRVLNVKNDKALILCDKIVEKKSYNFQYTDITWEKCSLRSYLNVVFYNKFSEEDKEQIAEVFNANHNNPWYDISGGSATDDKIFLLSIEEVVKYFGDSGQLKNQACEWWIDDQYNHARVAVNMASGAPSWWWLRSPGYYEYVAAYVTVFGNIAITGNGVIIGYGGIRPALWLKL